MSNLDELALVYVRQYGDQLRKKPYGELVTSNETQEGEVTELEVPSGLEPYDFVIRRGMYGEGIVRVYVEGSRPGKLGFSVRVFDAFDIHPNGEVIEIPVNDEDWCGRT